jgi:hypothetical protein
METSTTAAKLTLSRFSKSAQACGLLIGCRRETRSRLSADALVGGDPSTWYIKSPLCFVSSYLQLLSTISVDDTERGPFLNRHHQDGSYNSFRKIVCRVSLRHLRFPCCFHPLFPHSYIGLAKVTFIPQSHSSWVPRIQQLSSEYRSLSFHNHSYPLSTCRSNSEAL